MKNTINGLQTINKTDLHGMSRNEVLRLLQVFTDWKTEDDTDTVYRTQIEGMSSKSSSPSVQDFLIRLGFFPNPSVKKPRVKITKEVRDSIITDLTANLPTKEVAAKHGVTEDSVYNIKGKAGLTKRRGSSVTSPTVPVPIPTQPVTPSSVTPMAPSEPLKEAA